MKDVRSEFPILTERENGTRLVYLDNAATTQKPRAVLDAMADYYHNDNANPHRGVYELAMRATDDHENARKTVADFLNASADEIVFTQNTTESINLVAYSYGLNFIKAGQEIALSVAEHHSNLVPWQQVAQAVGAKLVYLYPGADGRLTEDEITAKIGPKTALVAIAEVSNVLGLAAPVASLVRRARTVGALILLDCAQSAPHEKIDVRALDVDFAAFSAHKLYGPMGVGVLYGKKEILDKMPPFLRGGDMIASVHEQTTTYTETPRKFEAGTRNVGGEVGLAAAIRWLKAIGWDELRAHERTLLSQALDGLAKLPYVTVYGDPTPEGRYGVISFNIEGVHPHDVATILDAEGVTVRAGHHCAQPLMEYLGIMACCRASFAVYNTPDDVAQLLDAVQKVRRTMGYGD